MQCPNTECMHDKSTVLDSHGKHSAAPRRRHRCQKCGTRFSTIEKVLSGTARATPTSDLTLPADVRKRILQLAGYGYTPREVRSHLKDVDIFVTLPSVKKVLDDEKS